MRKTIILSLALFAALAPAASAKSHPYTSSFKLSTLSTGGGYPAPGGSAVLSGPWNTSLGTGTVRDRVTITGLHGTIATFRADETDALPGGTLHSVATGWSLVRPDGTLAIGGWGSYVGGTGKFRHARGSFLFSGTGSLADGTSAMKSHGTIVY